MCMRRERKDAQLKNPVKAGDVEHTRINWGAFSKRCRERTARIPSSPEETAGEVRGIIHRKEGEVVVVPSGAREGGDGG